MRVQRLTVLSFKVPAHGRATTSPPSKQTPNAASPRRHADKEREPPMHWATTLLFVFRAVQRRSQFYVPE